jgi:hypothetical protein
MRVTVSSQPSNIVSINARPTTEVVAVGIQGPASSVNISQAGDVDLTNLVDGSLMIYKASSQKWTASTTLTAQSMDCGEF